MSGVRQGVLANIKEVAKVHDKLCIVGYNNEGYLTGLSMSNLGDVQRLLTDNQTSSVLCMVEGDTFFWSTTEENVSLPSIRRPLVDRYNEHVINQLSKTTNNDADKVEQELSYEKKLLNELGYYMKNKGYACSVTTFKVQEDEKVHSLEINVGLDLSVRLTGTQMCLKTPFGLVKVHDAEKDIDLNDIVKLMLKLFKLDKENLYHILSM